MIKHPPRHRADAPPVYVWDQDQAWKNDAFDDEKAEVRRLNADRKAAAEDAGETTWEAIDIDMHPVNVYRSGRTRMDIGAPCPWRGKQSSALDWLDENKGPVRFKLRRLTWLQWYEVTALTDPTKRCVAACQLGLESVEGDEALAVNPDLMRRSSDEMQALFDVSPELPVSIGAAVLAASMPLSDGEKKP